VRKWRVHLGSVGGVANGSDSGVGMNGRLTLTTSTMLYSAVDTAEAAAIVSV
jgi:hypothetical protein